jgi:DNA-directed RNA polymerase specialized sigma24 family protein
MARPLSKIKEDDGTLYHRLPEIEAATDVALSQDLDTLCRRAKVRDRQSTGYLPSECLVHLIREAHRHGEDSRRDTLLRQLLERCHANLNKKVASTIPNAARIRREILNDFAGLFATDGIDQNFPLDIYEVAFNFAFMRFRITHLRPVLDDLAQQVSYPEEEAETIEQELQDEVLARIADLRGDAGNPEAQVFRKQVYNAIVALPEDERKALLLVHYYGFKIESENPNEVTAATLCKVSGRMIRYRLKNAIAKLKKLKEHT